MSGWLAYTRVSVHTTSGVCLSVAIVMEERVGGADLSSDAVDGEGLKTFFFLLERHFNNLSLLSSLLIIICLLLASTLSRVQ